MKMEHQISDIADEDTTKKKKSMASLRLMCEKDKDEQRRKMDSFIASPFQKSMDSLLERAQSTSQSHGQFKFRIVPFSFVNFLFPFGSL